MLHLQAQRNLDVFLLKTGIRHYQPQDVLSFTYPDHRLDLAFRFDSLMMSVSVTLALRDDDAFRLLLEKAANAPVSAVLRVYCTQEELGINGVLADTDSAEAWYRLYQTQRSLINFYLNLSV
ncbi:hypothetical protein IB231_22115 [Pantoea sp. PNT02]|uniref:hypothetical protein n=1 Tax=Pantoea sp. PNT02 TaxID=2769261 RepID=UPI0017867B33|nr:hypothetical protein [Pantoea sp. PNT02]MBD9646320.1 hypothetical protein [Pantoea sp. PNT02]